MIEKDTSLNRAFCGIAFLERHTEHRAKIRELSKSSNKNLLTSHQFALSAIISYQNRIQGQPYEASNLSVKARMSLIAQFIQGVDITETAISEGLYAYAASLLKQELEIIAAIEEHRTGKRRNGRAPNVRNTLSNFYDLYGDLNDVAHPTVQEIVESLSTFVDGKRYGPTTIPQFNNELYQKLYGTQAMFLIMLLARMRTVFSEVLDLDWDDEETRLATSALRILIKEGIVKEASESP